MPGDGSWAVGGADGKNYPGVGGNFWGDEDVHHLDNSKHTSKLIKLYTLSMCSLFYVNYSSTRLFIKNETVQKRLCKKLGKEREPKDQKVCWPAVPNGQRGCGKHYFEKAANSAHRWWPARKTHTMTKSHFFMNGTSNGLLPGLLSLNALPRFCESLDHLCLTWEMGRLCVLKNYPFIFQESAARIYVY